jgi:hypothetical protein
MAPIALFPPTGFDESATTPVLLGVLASWFFTEAFGWVFAGLVVPGYLAAVFFLDPLGGTIDVFEAVVTYAAARAVGEYLSRTGVTSRFFGRERFFLVVVTSVLVRLGIEGLLLARVAPRASAAFSVGLVVVPLMANACWKTGLVRGIVQNGVPTLLVYLAVRYVLIPHTNFSLEGFDLATEDVAAHFLGSPKSYFLLMTGAAIAAATNLRYGWDFNGIMVPALLALVVLEPVKLAATLCEALCLVVVVPLFVRLTPLARANLEGPRRLTLYFAFDYLLRFAFAWVLGKKLPGSNVVGLMGFGYLLPTLLAVKMFQRRSVAVVMLPAAIVGVAAFALGTGVGFAATLLDDPRHEVASAAPRASVSLPSDPAAAAAWATSLTSPIPSDDVSSLQVRSLVAAVNGALAHREDAARAAGYDVRTLDGGVLLLYERYVPAGASARLPVVVLATRAAPEEPAVAVVEGGPDAAGAAATAAGLVSSGLLEAAVIGANVPPSTLAVESPALALARRLATARGHVVTVRQGARREVAISARARKSGRLAALASRFGAGAPPAESNDADSTLVVTPDDAVAALGGGERAAPESAADGPTAVALLLDAVEGQRRRTAAEHVVALRWLVLSPWLRSASPEPSELSRAFAAKLGYRFVRVRLSPASEGMLLLPVNAPANVAVYRAGAGPTGGVVLAPRAGRTPMRDAAIRLAAALNADRVVLGVTEDPHAMRGDEVRAALAEVLVTGSTRVVLLSEEHEAGAAAARVGAWGPVGPEAARDVQSALEVIGIRSSAGSVDESAKELAARALPPGATLVSVTAGEAQVRDASYSGVRVARRTFGDALPPFADGTLAATVATLVKKIAGRGGGVPERIGELARAAACERSIVAVRALAAAGQRGPVASTLLRTAEAEVLVTLAQDRGLVVDSHPVGADCAALRVMRAPSLEACLSTIGTDASCVVEAAR